MKDKEQNKSNETVKWRDQKKIFLLYSDIKYYNHGIKIRYWKNTENQREVIEIF